MIITLANATFIILCCLLAYSFVWVLKAGLRWRHKLVLENTIYEDNFSYEFNNKYWNFKTSRGEKMEKPNFELTRDEIETLNRIGEKLHAGAKFNGWWEEGKEKSALEVHMLIVSEIAEATEEIRSGNPEVYQQQNINGKNVSLEPDTYGYLNWSDMAEGERIPKPEGEGIEIVDAMIRCFDYGGRKDWKLGDLIAMKHKYNMTRGYRHGGKKY